MPRREPGKGQGGRGGSGKRAGGGRKKRDDEKRVGEDGKEADPMSAWWPMTVMGALFVLCIAGALLVTPLLVQEDVSAVEDEDSAVNPLLYLGFILAFTAVVLVVVKMGLEKLVQLMILGIVGMTAVMILGPALEFATGVGEGTATFAAAVTGLVLVLALYFHPEWWVVDAAGLLLATGVCAILGVSFSIGPMFILLVALAVYDAIAVYRTGHMVDLADSMVGLRLPILLVIPKSLDYSFLEQKSLKEQVDSGEERGAIFMGLGDIIIPGALCVAALVFLPAGTLDVLGMELYTPLLVSMGAMCGAAAGFCALMYYVLSGRPQAGLPLLNGGTIAGYVVAYLALYGDAGLGISLGL